MLCQSKPDWKSNITRKFVLDLVSCNDCWGFIWSGGIKLQSSLYTCCSLVEFTQSLCWKWDTALPSLFPFIFSVDGKHCRSINEWSSDITLPALLHVAKSLSTGTSEVIIAVRASLEPAVFFGETGTFCKQLFLFPLNTLQKKNIVFQPAERVA